MNGFESFMVPGAFLEVLAQEGEAPQGGGAGGGGLLNLLMLMLVIFMIFYVLVFRPEGKKRKERQKMIASVKKGDVIMTTGGLIGKVWRVDETEVVVQIDKDKDIKGRFARSAIFEVLKTDGAPAAKPPSEEAVRELEGRAKS